MKVDVNNAEYIAVRLTQDNLNRLSTGQDLVKVCHQAADGVSRVVHVISEGTVSYEEE